VFHLAFNVASAAVGLAFVAPLARLAASLGGDAARQIANAHVAFNVIGVLAALAVLGPAARLLERVLPPRPASADLQTSPDREDSDNGVVGAATEPRAPEPAVPAGATPG
jgi:Na+/phosphate symporter